MVDEDPLSLVWGDVARSSTDLPAEAVLEHLLDRIVDALSASVPGGSPLAERQHPQRTTSLEQT